ncbi:MAG: ECF transporter S component [Candidatus Limiplasma sp.]|nr:ECF transporter S component [Candidatus Limiplasma sp.]
MATQGKRLFTTRDMSTIAVLAAVASVLFVLEFAVVPGVPFYKMDFSNLPVLLGTFAMGPLAGTLILGIKSLVGLLHSSSQGVGELADFLIGLAMVLPAGFFYQKNKSRKGAIVGMAVGAVLASLTGIVLNAYLLIPFFSVMFHLPVEAIVKMGATLIPSIDSLLKFVLYITGPFNLLKWIALSVVGTLMYKPLSPILHGGRREAARRAVCSTPRPQPAGEEKAGK